MKVYVVNAFTHEDPIIAAAMAALDLGGHTTVRTDLEAEGFAIAMSMAERRAYHEADNLISPDTQAAAEKIAGADAFLFLYPTITHTVPARLKGFLDRVMLPEVAFTFDDRGVVSPALTNIRRIGTITRTPHSRLERHSARDGAHRTMVRSLRLNCHRLCRVTNVRVASDTTDLSPVTKALGKW